MRSTRRKNWFIKRMALGFAVAALAAPVAQARVDEGISGQPNSAAEIQKGIAYRAFVTDFPSVQAKVNAADYGMPRAMPSDYAINSGGQNDVVRADPPGQTSNGLFASSDVRADIPGQTVSDIGLSSQVVRADVPGETVSDIGVIGEPQAVSASSSFNWDDAAIGAGLALGLMLLAGGAVVATRHLGREQTA